MRLSAGSGRPGIWFLAELIALTGNPTDLRPLRRPVRPGPRSRGRGNHSGSTVLFVLSYGAPGLSAPPDSVN